MGRGSEGSRTPTVLEVIRAGTEDLPAILELLTEAADWARRRGVVGFWPVPFPEAGIRPSVERGDVYLGRRGDEVVGTVTLQWDDVPIWGERPADAGYIHRLAVRRSRTGEQVGAALLDWGSDQVRRRGRRFLRLDCRSNNVRLRRYYRDRGFRMMGTATVEGIEYLRWERALD